MELIIGYAVLIIAALVIYLVHMHYLTLQDLTLTLNELKKLFGIKSKSKNEQPYRFKNLDIENQYIHPSTLLLKSIEYLDYIMQFENYMESHKRIKDNAEYLKEFEKSKIESQLAVLKSAHIFSKSLSVAA